MNMGDAAGEEGNTPEGEEETPVGNEDENGQPPLGEALLNRAMKKVLNEQKRLKKDLASKRAHYESILVDRIEERRKQKEGSLTTIPLLDKNFLVNEEINSVAKQLKDLTKK